MLRTVLRKAKDVWGALDYVPDCRVCGGTGEPDNSPAAWVEVVWWKGRQVRVCHNCKGRGKV